MRMIVDIYVFVVQMRWIAVFRIRIFRIMGDFQDCDDAGASFCGYCLEASMTGRGKCGRRF